ARVIGNYQQESIGCLEHLAPLLHRQEAAVVGQRVDENGGVFPRFYDLVEVTDGARLDSPGQGTVDPAGGLTFQQITADEVAGGQVFVAGDGHDRQRTFAVVLG